MPSYNPEDPLDKAIYNGNVEQAKQLINSGASIPEHYKDKSYDNLMHALKLEKGFKHVNIVDLEESKAHGLAQLLEYTSKFDQLVNQAIGGRIMNPSEEQQAGSPQTSRVDKDEYSPKSEKFLEHRRGLQAFSRNHFAHGNQDLDLLSRLNARKEKAFEDIETQHKKGQTKIRHSDIGSRLQYMKEVSAYRKKTNEKWSEVTNLVERHLRISSVYQEVEAKDANSIASDLTEEGKESDSDNLSANTSNSSGQKSVRFNLSNDDSSSKNSSTYHSASSALESQEYYNVDDTSPTVTNSAMNITNTSDESSINSQRSNDTEQSTEERGLNLLRGLSRMFGDPPPKSHLERISKPNNSNSQIR